MREGFDPDTGYTAYIDLLVKVGGHGWWARQTTYRRALLPTDPHSARPALPRPAPSLLHKNDIEDGPAPCKDDNATSQSRESSRGGAPSLEIEGIYNLSSRAAAGPGFDELHSLQTSKTSVSLSPLVMQSWQDGR